MLPNIPRHYTQFISLSLMSLGLLSIYSSPIGWKIAPILGFLSLWVMVISESFLLTKVKNEMTASLELLRKKQEFDIQELLYFLRKSKLAANPLQTIESAIVFVDKIHFPALVMSQTFGIRKANKKFTDAMGYKPDEINGWPIARINNKVVMSEVGELVSKPAYRDLLAMHMRYMYVHKNGDNIFGNLDINKLADGSYLIVFHPDSSNIVNDSQLKSMINYL